MTAPSQNRRRALILMVSAGLVRLLPQPARSAGRQDLASLGAVLDVLFPADALCPSATALGVEDQIRQVLDGEGPLMQLFTLALQWLDALDGQPFRDLPPPRQARIIETLASSDYDQIPGRFYHIARALTVEFAYAMPEALAGLPLHAAPQPEGYAP